MKTRSGRTGITVDDLLLSLRGFGVAWPAAWMAPQPRGKRLAAASWSP